MDLRCISWFDIGFANMDLCLRGIATGFPAVLYDILEENSICAPVINRIIKLRYLLSAFENIY